MVLTNPEGHEGLRRSHEDVHQSVAAFRLEVTQQFGTLGAQLTRRRPRKKR